MNGRCHHRGKWRLTIEWSAGTIPVKVTPGIDQGKAIVIALYIHVDRVHQHGEDKRPDYRKKDCAPDIALHLTGNVRGELEADVLEEHYTGQANQSQQREVRASDSKTRLANSILNSL